MVELIYKALTFAVIRAAMEVHRILGSGFLEAVYQGALERELTLRAIPFDKKVKLPVVYKDCIIGQYEADLVIDNIFIIELKSVSNLNSSHEAQAIHYLAATGLHLALLLNLGTGSLEHRRVVR